MTYNKDCRDSIEHLDQLRATETKECCNITVVSCEKILEKEKEEDVNVSICPKNGNTIASVPANQGVDEKDPSIRLKLPMESYMKKDISTGVALTGTDSILGQKMGNQTVRE